MKPRNRAITLRDGRRLRFIEAGRPDGKAILAQNGTPGSGLIYDIWIDDAESRGIRLIGQDRPGHGGSTPRPGRSVVAGPISRRARCRRPDSC